jgi:hypothetical protein
VIEPKAQALDVIRWQLSPWAKWVAVIDDTGEVWEYEDEPHIAVAMWHWGDGSRAQCIGTINMAGIDWRRTLTAVNVEQQSAAMEEITQPSPTVEAIVRRWQQLDAVTECDLAAAMVRADEHAAEGFHMALGMALEAVRSPRYNSAADLAMAKQPAAHEVPAAQIAIHADALPGDVAKALVAQHSAGWCERLIEELDAQIEVAHDSERHARIWEKLAPFLQYDEEMAQLRVAQ